MHNAIATVSLSGTLEDKLRAAAAAGFDSVEIFENDLLGCALSPREVRVMLADLGLACSLYQPFRDFEGMPEPLRARTFDRAERKFDLMGELGTDRILICSNCSPHALGDTARIVDDFRELGGRAAVHGIRVGYEALAWGRHVNDHRQVWDIVKAVDHPAIGIILDSFHSLSRKIPSDSIAAIDGDKIVYVQLADAPLLDMDLLYWSRHFRNLPGQGGLDVTGFVAEILRTGYDGPLSLEIFNDRFRSNSAAMVASDGVRSLDMVRDAAMRRIGAATIMPPPATILGTEFVEFAVDPKDRERLSAMFTRMGFSPAGRHPTKDVTRWRNGAANLVMNGEPGGFAEAYRTTHGTSICAIGLKVADGPATVARAEALGIVREPTDLPAMPALRGVAGSLVYVVDQADADAIWGSEFRSAPAAPGAGSIEAIDHLAAVVPNDEFLSWQLYWRALFDVQVQTAQDVIDPSGLVFSQAIQSPDGGFRLTLNSTDARGTLSARFLHQSFGAGYQHVALRTADATATAAKLAAQGLETLAIPANYYDDLAARFGFTDAEIERMAALGLLFDRDAEGHDYRQFYSRAFDKHFFFEFVERQGYDGYGAPNAGIRLAAQNRYREEAVPL
ncbi:TIM barrel protein [Sphingomonas naphthae]|uniref:3-dehydroshikimate dehydratase n=1 Tax=Sphingomonas naphthae TaxID=1813468 RepID=A0ABY7TLZ9_9SPHN|nr:sugar phosphate isomerase/epimerase and 4-hydroxyphenylpyruvate domain-containing protein [Sphingomonas naphthae]WCT72864.1 TIM barrel protein [Sphingomonas naphthae]